MNVASEPLLRQAFAADIPAIWGVRYAVAENTLAPGRITDEDVRRSIEDTGRGWVVEERGEIQGFAVGNAETGNVWAMFVHPRAQGRGFGSLLHEAMLDWFRDQPVRTLWLTTGTATRARGFYERKGWTCAGGTGSGEVRYERENAARGDARKGAGPRAATGEAESAAIERCESLDHPGWLALREQLWPDCLRAEHLDEMAAFLAEPGRYAQFVARAPSLEPAGLLEVSLRHDYVNGTATSPVAYLEGIYVAPQWRRQGIARRLLAAGSAWARTCGCREFASDVRLGNSFGQTVHEALGFVESERVVFYRMLLA